jgi:hypothetical protein
MWFLLLLFIASPVSIDCFTNYDEELQRNYQFQDAFDTKLSEFNPNEQNVKQIKKFLMSDTVGINLSQSNECLRAFNEHPKSNNNLDIFFGFNFEFSTDFLSAPFVGIFDSKFDIGFFSNPIVAPAIGAGMGALVGATITILGTNYSQKRTILLNSRVAVIRELDQLEPILKNKIDFTSTTGVTYRYAPYLLTTTAFDSIVSSGAFLRFSPLQQRRLVTLYFHIKEHNRLLTTLRHTILKASTEFLRPGVVNELLRSYQRIVINENRILHRYLGRVRNVL